MDNFLNGLILFLNFVVVPATSYGAQLALGALGVNLIFGVLRFSNFAHGDTMAFGTMLTILGTWALQSAGFSLGFLPTALAALPLGIAGTILFCLATDRLIYAHYRRQKAAPVVFMMASMGVMFILNGVVRVIIGPDERNFADGERFLVTAQQFKDATGLLEGLTIRTSQALTLTVAMAAVLALFLFLQRTRRGSAMRAFSDNETLALLCGVSPKIVIRTTWVIAATLMTIAGVLYGLDKSFRPFTYFQILLPIFAAAIVGGFGRPAGSIIGGFIVAFSEIALTYAYRKVVLYFMPGSDVGDSLLQLVPTDYKFSISFVILVVILVIAPTGILKAKSS
ncbi:MULTISPECIES: branched-chain amino acid ABC transporter permease [unclassified Mesorhizobium]|uniref:branched-chain amino acid ABC transporter permease n=1 Tax=unclassified Mesorhizobium TaxID=325217 RepID=UPI001092B78B|nr:MULTISPECIES: branched-chain amino acid ABC transporter permease [unclassified Mesorhizobium]TGS43744.1 branched-chain amino acid ABC transporter permease [Mesorhizobium sp. M8A.F.Ca.ET.182.01.1.1]TGS78325.1 branched-chain amino acid ABC transporter permease [Mesorhizobium sp. M8A.F.Ca.ET.181.01.1.1]TGV15463.1 branched-chain amino acid ABC transporter permease [Mesorhizobium sp. M8A.F.Ca.ET.173.01.1.1]